MRRRALMLAAGSALACAGLDRVAAQQGQRPWRIGRFSPLSAANDAPMLAAIAEGLRERGWAEGRDYEFDRIHADGEFDRLPELAAEMVRRKVDVMVAGSNMGALAAKRATNSVPIVMVTAGDPMLDGIVDSLARPGANITGVTALGEELAAKRLEVLRRALPAVSRAAILLNPGSLYTPRLLAASAAAAPTLGFDLTSFHADNAASLDAAFAAMSERAVEALLVPPDAMFIDQASRIVALAARSRLPAIYGERVFVARGGLMFYGASLVDMYRRSAHFIDRILRGARPADLPIEQPTVFELAVNLRTARALGLEIPAAILAQADEVIE